eukprot:472586-Rhodomonas_salina.2
MTSDPRPVNFRSRDDFRGGGRERQRERELEKTGTLLLCLGLLALLGGGGWRRGVGRARELHSVHWYCNKFTHGTGR